MDAISDPVVIVGYARTPLGKFQGALKELSAPRLGAAAISGALAASGIDLERVDRVILGNVLSAGIGQAPARQAAIAAGLDVSVPCLTVNKMCGSGMEAVLLAHDLINAGSANVVVAGGMESMSNAPFLFRRIGARTVGHQNVSDHLVLDGLEDPWEHRVMGEFAEDCAQAYRIARDRQDRFAYESLDRSLRAADNEFLKRALVPLESRRAGHKVQCDRDELPPRDALAKIAELKPVFRNDGTLTVASSSGIADGAASVVLTKASIAAELDLDIKARIRGHTTYAGRPGLFPVAPVHSIARLLAHVGLKPSEIDLFEINEAFAVVPLIAMQELKIPHSHVNVHGGACAMGHPIGASGARILVTLLSSLEERGLKCGLASLCIGGGEATALLVQR